MLAGCRGDFEVVRYHSLTVREESLPPCLEPVAWTCGKHHAVALTEAKTEVSPLMPKAAHQQSCRRTVHQTHQKLQRYLHQ